MQLIKDYLLSLRNEISKLTKKQIIGILCFIVICTLAGYLITKRLVISTGASIPYNLFFVVDIEPTLSSYVIIQKKDNQYTKNKLITKQIKCMPKNVLTIRDREYLCNNEFLGIAKTHSLEGDPLKNWNPCNTSYCKIIIPEDMYFVMGNSKDSYDSRYFGLVSKKEVVRVVKPIF